ncbi:S10 family peptidase [Rhizosphaericola mali]|uniref:Peptidase S10 n=1 Tax=Rhizosphaericola mali TaxID=2545455 RepID=A0A5P2G2I9_9BACT|nr:peptidase S10 [Rhizosphaericola mali]QES87313.1 peptidase S10 [Rhizosphaericola mali]
MKFLFLTFCSFLINCIVVGQHTLKKEVIVDTANLASKIKSVIPEFTTDISANIPKPTIAKHKQTIGGKEINYTTTTGYIQLTKEDGTATGNVFFVAYTKDDESKKTRPLTFAFNGGPGSASVWVHMGFMGPKRPILDDFGNAKNPPYGYVDNPDSWLDQTDLIFIDPVSTGYSRAVKGQDANQFHGYEEDVSSVGDFIRLYVTKYERWSSPKFIMGESYGTPRAAGLSSYLQDKYGMYFNGIILLSSILNMETARFDIGNDLPYPLFLPTYASSAWYHKKLSVNQLNKSLSTFMDEVKKFDVEVYEPALMKGSDLSKSEMDNVATQLSNYTGLSKDYIIETNLRINIMRFCKELTRKDGYTIGRLDSRYKGYDLDDAGERFEYDPTGTTVGAFAASWNDYVRSDLKYKNELPYNISGPVHPWNYNNVQNKYLNTAEYLRQAMTKNPHLKVWVICGYYDLATPFYAAEYTFKHMNLRPELQENLHFTYYEAGHMVYMHYPSMKQFKQDAIKMYNTSK